MVCTPDQIIGYDCGGSALLDFTTLAGAALLTSAVILSALYVWGAMFRSQQINNYVKLELYELIVSAFLVILITMAVGAMGTITLGGILPDGMLPDDVTQSTTVYQATYQYYERVGSDMAGWLNVNYWLSMYIDQIASVTPYARPLGVGLVASPMAGLASPLKQLLYNMSVALSVAFVINSAQKFVYLFALQAFLKYYLPIGIFFRTFTPTRKLGGALIGVALSFLFVFPALSTISYSMFYNRDAGPLITFGNMLTNYFGDTTTGFWERFGHFFGNNFTDVGTSVSDLAGAAFGGIGQLLQTLVGGIFLTIMMFPISVVSYAFAIGFVIPAFNILVFTQVAKTLSKSFGEEVDIGTLTRLV
ncbi:MAG: hypothetical protein ABH983_05900 [Candidatus Micrarchaeota archaeon]